MRPQSDAVFSAAVDARVKQIIEERSIDVAALPKSSQDKIEAAMRRRARELEFSIERRVQELYQKALENVWPELERREREATSILNARRGIMSRKLYLAILSALHPDSRAGFTEERLASLFQTLKTFEVVICKEAEFPTSRRSLLPKGKDEWAAMKQRAAAGKAKQGPQGVAKRR